jgi:hypothetical protein
VHGSIFVVTFLDDPAWADRACIASFICFFLAHCAWLLSARNRAKAWQARQRNRSPVITGFHDVAYTAKSNTKNLRFTSSHTINTNQYHHLPYILICFFPIFVCLLFCFLLNPPPLLPQYYSRQVKRIADVSIRVALMTPHAIFLAAAAGVKLVFPESCLWLVSETKFLLILTVLYPLAATIFLNFDFWHANFKETHPAYYFQQQQNSESPAVETSATNGAQPQLQGVSPNERRSKKMTPLQAKKLAKRSTNRKRRSSIMNEVRKLNGGGVTQRLAERQRYWIQHWMVYGALQCVRRLFHQIPLATRMVYPVIAVTLAHLEWVFWTWLIVLPWLTPEGLKSNPLYATPVEFLCQSVIGPVTNAVHAFIARSIPEHLWQQFVVSYTEKFLTMLVWGKWISQETAEVLVHLSDESRCIILPVLTIFSWPLQPFGILYVAYALPLAKSGTVQPGTLPAQVQSKRTAVHWLQFWVGHTLVTALVDLVAGILYWIPFSNIAIFTLYASMSIASATTVESYYFALVQQELQAFCVLPFLEHQEALPFEQTKAVKIFHWILDKLPSAADPPSDALHERGKEEEDNCHGANAAVEEDNDVFVNQNPAYLAEDEKENGSVNMCERVTATGEVRKDGATLAQRRRRRQTVH